MGIAEEYVEVKSRGKSDGHSIVRRMNASRLHPPVLLKK
jgi:hypothetical protein